MTDLDVEHVDRILDRYAPHGRTALLPALIDLQAAAGHISEPVAERLARRLGVPLADIHSVIEFYSMLYRHPVGRTIARVCTDPACVMRGADGVFTSLCARAGVGPTGGTSLDSELTVERAPCIGLCDEAVAVNLTRLGLADASFVRAQDASLDDLLAGRAATTDPYVGGDVRLLTSPCCRGRAATLAEYEAAGGMAALRATLVSGTPDGVIDALKRAGLVGRGGAAFPTGVKWEATRAAPGPVKYIVVNGDESEPGTFKDRVLMDEDPLRVIEGAILCGFAVGASKGYFYIRGEYPTCIERVNVAIAECRASGLLGRSILGSGFDFELEVRSGAGAYLCGEETALLESIEGRRGFPRIKPPYPVTHGLFGKPTCVNNVETLAAAQIILQLGADAYRAHGTAKSPGTKLFCVSGDVARPGLYEMPFGITLRHLLDSAGGASGDLQAVLLGGAAGAFAVPAQLDVRLSFEDLRAAGLTLGSGAVMVFNQSRDLRAVLAGLTRFFAHESCGKCYPCQLGTQRQMEVMERVAAGQVRPGDVERLQDVGWTMTDASLCGFGQTAALAVHSAMRQFPGLFATRGGTDG